MTANSRMMFATLTVAAIALCTTSGETVAPNTQISVASMFINADDPIEPGLDPRVLPVGSPDYRDYRWPGSAGDPCVEGWISPIGAVFMRLNRRVQPQDVLCHTIEGDEWARQYTLIIDNNQDACVELGASYDSNNQTCSFTTPFSVKQPFVEPGPVFKNKVTKTQVTFYFTVDSTETTYRITTDTNAVVVPVNSNSKVVQYSGTVTLARSESGYVPLTSFRLPFRMRFDRALVSAN